jgi:hypothetical protein
MSTSDEKRRFCIDLTNTKVFMEVKTGPFEMEELVTKVVEPEANPTVLLLEWQPGFVIGGFAGIPWPKDESRLDGTASVLLASICECLRCGVSNRRTAFGEISERTERVRDWPML